MRRAFKQFAAVWREWRQWPGMKILGWAVAVWCVIYLLSNGLHSGWRLSKEMLSDWGYSIENWLSLPNRVIPVLLMIAAPALIVGRVKRETRNWQSSLVPGYRRPQLWVAGTMLLAIGLIVGLGPALLEMEQEWLNNGSLFALSRGWTWMNTETGRFEHLWNRPQTVSWWRSPWPLAALEQSFFIAILVAWITGWLNAWLAAACAAAGVLMVNLLGWGDVQWHTAMHFAESDADLIVRTLALETLLMVELWLRLAAAKPLAEPVQADERAPWLNNLLAGKSAALANGWMAGGLWQRARHRRTIGLGRRFVIIVAAYVALLVVASPVLQPYGKWFGVNGFAFGALAIAVMVCGLAMGLAWPQRFAALADVELLRPATRREFAREIGIAYLLDAAELSAATLAALLVPVAIWTPAAMASSHFWCAAVAGILSLVLIFGAIAWTMRSRRLTLSAAALAVTAPLSIGLMDAALGHKQLLPALAAAAIGVGLAAHAYRRWQKAEAL